MTVTTTTNKTLQAADGVQTVFPYLFVLPDASWLEVYYNNTLILLGYTVSGVGNASGGDVTFSTAPPAGVTVTLLRVAPDTQEVDYQPYDAFPAETHEGALDKLTLITQQLQEQVDRTVSEPIGGGGGFDVKGGLIVNLGSGSANTDGANIGQVISLAQPAADAAAASASAASASAAAAAASAAEADAAVDSIVPTYIGEMTLWNTVTAPAEYLLCDGAVYEQAAYPALFAALGVRFNTGGETGTQFRVPAVIADDPVKTAWIIRSGAQSGVLATAFAAGNDTSVVGVIAYWHGTPPAEWLVCNGQSVLKSAYPALWTRAQGFLTADQVANPGLFVDVDASNFRVPELQGFFLRTQNITNNGQPPTAALGARQTEMIGPHAHNINVSELANGDTQRVLYGGGGSSFSSAGPISNNTGTENRPDNVAFSACIRALSQRIDGYWFGANKFVSAAAPTAGDGQDNDIWFQAN